VPRYKPKAVEIEARRLPLFDVYTDVNEWRIAAGFLAAWCGGVVYVDSYAIGIDHSDFFANPGDYILKDPRGDFDYCNPQFFEQEYELVEE
jgi:hypothetical protein